MTEGSSSLPPQPSQSVTTALDVSSPPVEVGIVGGPPGAPFGLADGSAWAIAPWAPPR